MKTSKRFLSIVLMLAMLVSMFTVMAFADDDVQIADDERRITLAVGDNGKVMVEKTEYTGTSTQVLKKNAVLKAVPTEGRGSLSTRAAQRSNMVPARRLV